MIISLLNRKAALISFLMITDLYISKVLPFIGSQVPFQDPIEFI